MTGPYPTAVTLLLAVALLLLPLPTPAQTGVAFLVSRARTLRAAADQASADLNAASESAAVLAAQESAASEALTDAQNATGEALQLSLDEMNAAFADAKYDLDDASRTLLIRQQMLADYHANPAQHPAIPAALKAISDATRRVKMTQMLVDEWIIVIAEATAAVREAKKAAAENTSAETDAALAAAEAMKAEAEDIYPDMLAQAERSKARLAKAQQEYDTLVKKGSASIDYFQLALNDAAAYLAESQAAYDAALAAVKEADQALKAWAAKRAQTLKEAANNLAKAKVLRASADKKVVQLADRAKTAAIRAVDAEKAVAAAGLKL